MTKELNFQELWSELQGQKRLSSSSTQSMADFYGRPIMAKFEVSSVNVAGLELALYKSKWERPRRALVFHGLFDHASTMSYVVERLLEFDYEVWLIDLPDHGLSVAKLKTFADYGHILQALARPDDLFVGFSTGCVAWLQARSCERALLLAPLVRPHFYELLSPFMALPLSWPRFLPARLRPSSHDQDYLALRALDPLVSKQLDLKWCRELYRWNERIKKEWSAPQLGLRPCVVFGTEDGTIDAKMSADILERHFGIQAHWIAGARHQLLNESAEYLAKLRPVITTYLSSI